MGDPNQVLLSSRALGVGYAGRPLLPPIDLEVRRGEFWAVVGRNGSGKSTWFRTMLGLHRPLAGRVERAQDLRLAYVAQRIKFDDLYPIEVREVVAMGRTRGGSFLQPIHPGERAAVDGALEAVGAGDLGARTFRSLSEGQKQRVLLARMIASEADLVFLDEPTAAMDAVAEREAMRLLHDLRDRYGLAMVVVSHYLDVVSKYADKVLFLDPDVQAVVVGTPSEVFDHPAFRARYAGADTEEVPLAQ